jgi:hypothetical protein
MAREKKKPSRLAKALLETARDMRRGELLDEAAYAKITMRHLGENEVPKAEPITGEENSRVEGEGTFTPGGVLPSPEPDSRLCLEIGTRRETADWRGARSVEREPPQGTRSDPVESALRATRDFVFCGQSNFIAFSSSSARSLVMERMHSAA